MKPIALAIPCYACANCNFMMYLDFQARTIRCLTENCQVSGKAFRAPLPETELEELPQ